MMVTIRGLHDGDHKGGCMAVTIRGLHGGYMNEQICFFSKLKACSSYSFVVVLHPLPDKAELIHILPYPKAHTYPSILIPGGSE